MSQYYVLDRTGEPQLEPNVDAWLQWFEGADRALARTAVGPEILVLTTFSGVHDDAEQAPTPRLFHTHVFGGALDGEEVRSVTREEALVAHEGLLGWCRAGNSADRGITDDQLR